MTTNTPHSNDPIPALSADALLEWEGHAESVLRGVAHALNNRAASMSALMELVAEPDYTTQSTRQQLSTEVERLHELVGVVRAVGVPRGGIEAFEPAEAAKSASVVVSMHAALRDRNVTINANVPPVRTYKWLFVRALVVLAGRAASADRNAAVTLGLAERDGYVEVSASVPVRGPSRYLEEIAAVMGGESLANGFRIPTLATLRRREGR